MATKYYRGVLLCLLAAVSWGGMFQVMNGALGRIDPFTFTCLRYGLAGAAFLALLVVLEGRGGLTVRRGELGRAWLFGTAGFAGFQFLVFWGQQLAGAEGALLAAVLSATMPVLAFLVNWVAHRVVPSRGALGCALLSFAGVALVITKGDIGLLTGRGTTLTAAGLIVLGSLCWVGYSMGATHFPHWSAVKYTAVTTALGLTSASVVTAVALAGGAVPVPTTGTVWLVLPELGYMAFVAGFAAVLAWNWGNRIIGPVNGMLFEAVVPVVAFAVSAFAGTVPAPVQLFGAVLAAAAVVVHNLNARRSARTTAAGPQGAGRSKRPLTWTRGQDAFQQSA